MDATVPKETRMDQQAQAIVEELLEERPLLDEVLENTPNRRTQEVQVPEGWELLPALPAGKRRILRVNTDCVVRGAAVPPFTIITQFYDDFIFNTWLYVAGGEAHMPVYAARFIDECETLYEEFNGCGVSSRSARMVSSGRVLIKRNR